jgi:hypothetical protein
MTTGLWGVLGIIVFIFVIQFFKGFIERFGEEMEKRKIWTKKRFELIERWFYGVLFLLIICLTLWASFR